VGVWWVNLRERFHLERYRRRWEDNIETDVKEMSWEGVDWIDMAQDRDR
jgi:hypothetical protein